MVPAANFTATAANQAPGAHEVCATATGTGPASDASSQDTATRCETYLVFGFGVAPLTATNELGQDNSHTVTATVTGAAGELDGWPVSFSVNGGASGPDMTDSNGEAAFTYTVPVEPGSLGADTIRATVDINGDTATVEVTKEWVDTTPPAATRVESVNPNGRNVPNAPGNGGQGQNQDGFYQVGGSDDVWPADSLQVFVTDEGSGTVFGPFASGDNIKYTQAGGAVPKQKSIGGPNSAVSWHITGNGDAVVTTVDGSGNVSNGASCLVPPPPK